MWRHSHPDGPSHPQTNAEKMEFKDALRSRKRTPEDENFEEALSQAFRVFKAPTLSPTLLRILDDPAADVIHTSSQNPFWILVAALKHFLKHVGDGSELPVTGSIPDMKASTTQYTSLQRIYRAQAARDFSEMRVRVDDILESLHLPRDHIHDETLKTFIKHASSIEVRRGRPIKDYKCESTPAKQTSLIYVQPHAARPRQTNSRVLPGTTIEHSSLRTTAFLVSIMTRQRVRSHKKTSRHSWK